jgi:hypothetical protein
MWPVSTRVKSPDNDDSSLLDPASLIASLGSLTDRTARPLKSGHLIAYRLLQIWPGVP